VELQHLFMLYDCFAFEHGKYPVHMDSCLPLGSYCVGSDMPYDSLFRIYAQKKVFMPHFETFAHGNRNLRTKSGYICTVRIVRYDFTIFALMFEQSTLTYFTSVKIKTHTFK
jgi:hypothetical protein